MFGCGRSCKKKRQISVEICRFKKEEAYRRDYTSESGFRKSVDQFVEFYNEVRPHKTIKYKTPDSFEELYYSKEKAAI